MRTALHSSNCSRGLQSTQLSNLFGRLKKTERQLDYTTLVPYSTLITYKKMFFPSSFGPVRVRFMTPVLDHSVRAMISVLARFLYLLNTEIVI